MNENDGYIAVFGRWLLMTIVFTLCLHWSGTSSFGWFGNIVLSLVLGFVYTLILLVFFSWVHIKLNMTASCLTAVVELFITNVFILLLFMPFVDMKLKGFADMALAALSLTAITGLIGGIYESTIGRFLQE